MRSTPLLSLRRALLGSLVAGMLLVVPARAQLVRVTTDKAIYSAREPIQVLITVTNPTDSTARYGFPYPDGPPCSGTLVFDHVDAWVYVCATQPRTYTLGPGARIEWRRTIVPASNGLPSYDGTHTVRVAIPIGSPGRPSMVYRDSVTIEAPATREGLIELSYRTADSVAVRRVRDSLRAERRSLYLSPSFSVETWKLVGHSIDSLAPRLRQGGLFPDVIVQRFLSNRSEQVVSAVERVPRLRGGLVGPWPQPASSVVRFRFTAPATGLWTAQVYGVDGRQVAHIASQAVFEGASLPVELATQAWPAGVYMLRWTLGRLHGQRPFVVGP